MKRVLLAAALFLAAASAPAQPRITYDQGSDGKSVVFTLVDKNESGTTTVLLRFAELSNCIGLGPGVHKYAVCSDNARFLTLRPLDREQHVGFDFAYRTFHGVLDPKHVDTNFVYRMPCAAGRPVEVGRTVDVLDEYTKGDDDPKEYLGFVFLMRPGDTVYAMRRGVVRKIRIPERGAEDVRFTTRTPSLEIEQPDGTIARYITLDAANLFVGEGDEVLPSTPLALVGTQDGEHYRLSVQICWAETNPEGTWEQDYLRFRRYFPRFRTTDGDVVPGARGTYTPLVDEALVAAELTKKEIKRLSATRK